MERAQVAQHMCHNTHTQEKYYRQDQTDGGHVKSFLLLQEALGLNQVKDNGITFGFE